MTDSTAVAPRGRTYPETKLDLVKARLAKPQFAAMLRAVLPKHVTPERMTRIALLAINDNPKLLDCDVDSIAVGVLTIATWGLEVGRTAYLIPYGSKAQAQCAWQGMIELAMRGRTISSCVPTIIYANDEFSIQRGSEPRVHHVPEWQGDPGEPIGVYAVITFPNGQRIFDLMSKREVEAHRDRYSRAFKNKRDPGPWGGPLSEQLEMWKKTMVIRILKLVPQNPTLAEAMASDEGPTQTDAEILAGLVGRPRPGIITSGGYGEEPEHDNPQEQNPQAVEPGDAQEPEVKTTTVNMHDRPVRRAPRRSEGVDPYHCLHGVVLTRDCVECQQDAQEGTDAAVS
jgi:recombination protein RecT